MDVMRQFEFLSCSNTELRYEKELEKVKQHCQFHADSFLSFLLLLYYILLKEKDRMNIDEHYSSNLIYTIPAIIL